MVDKDPYKIDFLRERNDQMSHVIWENKKVS